MLCSVSNLEVLRADEIQNTDIDRNSRPWICLGWKELDLQVMVMTRSLDSESTFLAPLSALKRLEKVCSFSPRKSSPICFGRRPGSVEESLSMEFTRFLHAALWKEGNMVDNGALAASVDMAR